MKFSKFSELVNRILSNNHSHRRDMDVTIVIHSPGSIGSTPSVEVQSIHAGFDWDSGKVLIFPAQPLTTLTPEQITDITDSVRKGQSWHAYQEYKKHKEQLEKLSIELDAAKQRIAELEKSEEQLINERDHAESALDDMYFAATGNRPEWSNWFGFSDAVDAVVDRIADLEAKQPSPVVPEGLVKAVRFYEQVKRENPPAETGAWKDAVDWVLKEACQVVNTGIKGD